MKIGIDTFACEPGKSGIGDYLAEILKRIPPSGDSFEMFGWEYDRYAFSEYAPNFEFIPQCSVTGRTANALWHLYKYPEFAKSRSYRACFFPAAHKRLPYKSPCPTVGVVHDLASYFGSRRTREHLGAVLRMALPDSLKSLDRVIAVSQWVKGELINLIGVKESRIEVVPSGVDHAAFYPEDHSGEDEILLQPFSFRRPYILCVSRIDYPVKNHIRLIKAFNLFKERTGFPHRLVLAGGDANNAGKVKSEAAKSPFMADIFFTGFFPKKSLPKLYTGADFTVFPSLYEGFGLGVVEAMACGVPVICARAASFPETADTSALYFDPLNIEDMTDRMVVVAENRDLHEKFRLLGLKRAASFSWETCAKRTLSIIQGEKDTFMPSPDLEDGS
jgi:glycosyltransferase involved in cell wall biosynthesis